MDPGGTGFLPCHALCLCVILIALKISSINVSFTSQLSCPPGGKNRLLRKLEFEGRLGHACSAYLSSAASRIESATKVFFIFP